MIFIEKQVRMGAEKKKEAYYEERMISACIFMEINNV